MTREYAEDQLVGLDPSPADPWGKRLSDGAWVSVESFRARLIAARLTNPQIDHIYALRSARIQFIPFQFKPVLRLLRSDRPRLLIADDVGVGKTIEAGLILKELTTRQRLDRVLVVCPKALTVKWRAEMRRFDEDFRILNAGSLRYCLDEVALEGVWPAEYSRAIVHYELARMEPYLMGTDVRGRHHMGLLELNPAPQFDLIIADEAHHLRTPGTGQHQLMEYLCDVGEAVLMLSATPVQVSTDNLFVLLSLLRPDLFPDRVAFGEILEPNRHITSAIGILRAGSAAGPDWLHRVRVMLTRAAETAWGRSALIRDPTFARVVRQTLGEVVEDSARVQCIRDLEEVHSLAHVMNRTRRRDIGRFTIREPRTVSVRFSDEQQSFYDNVLRFRRQVLLEKHPPQMVNLILDTLERQAASSITALAAGISTLLSANGFQIGSVTDDPEFDDSGAVSLPNLVAKNAGLTERAMALVAEANDLPDDDPKFDRLMILVRQTVEEVQGPGKVLIFSFFLHTLAYLRRRLVAENIRAEVINGQTPDELREELRDRFRLDRSDPLALDLLLSSEVGCEGLDYEFCDRLVNYDIPWNPMRLEQRIGRIDRFGQESEKVLIFNFVTPGTVEERVFFRCFERLGLFTDTVGDLEEVLGPMVQELTHIALERSLTPEQADDRARQVADNAIRLAQEQRRLDAESATLLGLDDAFTADVGSVVDHGRFVDEDDVESLIASFLAGPSIAAVLNHHSNERRTLHISQAGREALAVLLRSLPRDRTTTSFMRSVELVSDVPLTFNQKAASADRSIDFVTPVHPLARLAVQHWNDAPDPLVGALRLSSALIAPGRYLFVCERWETIAARPDVRLECLAISLDTELINDALGRELLGLLRLAQAIDRPDIVESSELLSQRLHQLVSASETRRRSAVTDLVEANDVLIDRRLASLQSFYDNRLRRIREESRVAAEPRIMRMKAAELSRVEFEYNQRANDLERARTVEILSQRVAVGYVEVMAYDR